MLKRKRIPQWKKNIVLSVRNISQQSKMLAFPNSVIKVTKNKLQYERSKAFYGNWALDKSQLGSQISMTM